MPRIRPLPPPCLCLLALGCPPADPPITGPDDDDSGAPSSGTVAPTTGFALTEGLDTDYYDTYYFGTYDFDTEDPTMGDPLDPDADVGEMCMHLCERISECGADPGLEGCPCDDTVPEHCVAEWYEVTNCFDQAVCTELYDFEHPCWLAMVHAYEKCEYGEDGCGDYIGGSFPEPPTGTCSFGRDCLDKPSKDVECELDVCTCSIEGVEVGMCPGDGVCAFDDEALVAAKIDECCGP